jgi:hypothetical protein
MQTDEIFALDNNLIIQTDYVRNFYCNKTYTKNYCTKDDIDRLYPLPRTVRMI